MVNPLFQGNGGTFDIQGVDFVIDAIDTLSHKLDLVETALAAGMILASLVPRDVHSRAAPPLDNRRHG